MGYNLKAGKPESVKVELIFSEYGQPYSVAHIFRAMTIDEWNQFKSINFLMEDIDAYNKEVDKIWRDIIISTEGYEIDENKEPSIEEVIDLVPTLHKDRALAALVDRITVKGVQANFTGRTSPKP